ncbi:MAG TPA: hypothetical protein VFG86_16760, partial [Chloroflexota bacterium]|nr:hypothetical protein [Chloroflexota bacterium]
MAQAELVHPLASSESRASRGIIAAAAMVVALAVGMSVGGHVGRFAVNGLVYAPGIVLAGLLQLRRWKSARVSSWIWFWVMLLSLAGLSFDMASVGIGGLDPQRVVGPLLVVLAILLIGCVVAATPLWVGVARALGARSLDRTNPAHAQGTVGILVGSALALAPLALLGGRAPLLDLLNQIDTSSIGMAEQVVDQVSSLIWSIVLVLWASAWPMRLDLRGALGRLGVTRLHRQDALPLLAITLRLVGLGFALDFLSRAVFTWLGWPLTDASVVTRLVSVATTP